MSTEAIQEALGAAVETAAPEHKPSGTRVLESAGDIKHQEGVGFATAGSAAHETLEGFLL